MAYTTQQALNTLNGYLGIQEEMKEYIENTKKRGFVLTLESGEKIVMFVYPLVHKQDNTKNYFDTRDSGAYERGITWRYALKNGYKYFCIGVNDQVEKYKGYIFSLECDEAIIEKISGTKNGSRNGRGNQIIIPNDYIPSKPFERIKNKLGIFISVISKDCMMDYIEKCDNRPYMKSNNEVENSELTIQKELTPEWFKEKAKEYPTLDEEADQLYVDFQERFSPDILENLSGKDILSTIFLNPYNKDNLCRIMEYDKKNRGYFGSIRSGNASKYGLYYSPKEKSWITGTTQNPVHISEDDAINIGTQIRDYLVEGSKILDECDNLDTVDKFSEIYNRLVDVTGGYINKIWVLKYYHMMYPDFYPPIYSEGAQKIVLERIGREVGANPFERLGEMKEFVNECEISNVMFNKIMWSVNTDEEMEEDMDEEEITDMLELKTCLEIERRPRINKIFPLNYIVYGAPGTGKTYSMIENALAIIDNIALDEFRANNTDRKANVNRYKELVKAGQIVFTTFHQNYGYEEFIQGLRPDKNSDTMKFETVDGVFKRIADRALNDEEDNNYVIIIDEINRANISKVFGELITLIEEDKRWGELNEMSATLQSGDAFAVPNNLYIVGTMNSADKSISLVDVALRRRFDFVEQKPDASLVKSNLLKAVFENINEFLVNELESTDLLVGHSYFMNKEEKDLCSILNNNIIPLLYEYFYDNRKKVAKILTDAISKAGAKVEIVDDKIGRLSVKDKVE